MYVAIYGKLKNDNESLTWKRQRGKERNMEIRFNLL